MGRKVSGPRPGDEREFVPESFENHLESEPVKIWIKDPTEGEKRRLQLMQTELQTNGGDILRDSEGTPQITITLEAMNRHQEAAIRGHVTRVSGYEVRGVEIKTGQDLIDHGETEFISETALEITTALSLTAEQKKT